jgi:hypothetical protein
MGDKPPAFQPPPWAAAPSCSAWLEAHGAGDAPDAPPLETIRVDAAPFVTFGRDAEAADVHLDDRHAPHSFLVSFVILRRSNAEQKQRGFAPTCRAQLRAALRPAAFACHLPRCFDA